MRQCTGKRGLMASRYDIDQTILMLQKTLPRNVFRNAALSRQSGHGPSESDDGGSAQRSRSRRPIASSLMAHLSEGGGEDLKQQLLSPTQPNSKNLRSGGDPAFH
jgi:hypothetical protein